MTCEERQDLILLYAADALDAGERADVAAHLAGGCARCAGALTEAEAVVAAMALTAEPVEPSLHVRDRLVARLRQLAPPPAPAARGIDYARAGTGRPRRARRLGTLGTALLAACVAGLLGGLSVWVALRDQARLPGAPEVQYVALQGGETQPLARGRIFWDTVRHRWHVYLFDVKPAPPGRVYQLWFVVSQNEKIPADTFHVDASGKASLNIPLPQDIAPIVAAAVTDEPPGGSSQPTGEIQLLARAR